MRRPSLMTLGFAALALATGMAAAPAHAARRKAPSRKAAPAAPAPAAATPYDDTGVSTAVDSTILPNGVALWGVNRPGTHAATAVVIRAGARQEDVGGGGVATAAAHWVLESWRRARPLPAAPVEMTMLQGGVAFVVLGAEDAVRTEVQHVLRAAMGPAPALTAAGRDHGAHDARRTDTRVMLHDVVSALCWPGSSFELPTYGAHDLDATVEDAALRQFHRTWYQPRNVTIIAVGPGGHGSYATMATALSRERKSRETVAPGNPGLPMHQMGGGAVGMTVAGVALPGPQLVAPAFLVRAHAREQLDRARREGRLSVPTAVDMVWTRKHAVVFAAVVRAGGTEPDDRAQAEELRQLEAALVSTVDLSGPDLNALRKREGTRISREFATAEGALGMLMPLATVVDAPLDLRRDVMGAPVERVTQALGLLRDDNTRLTLRRSTRKDR